MRLKRALAIVYQSFTMRLFIRTRLSGLAAAMTRRYYRLPTLGAHSHAKYRVGDKRFVRIQGRRGAPRGGNSRDGGWNGHSGEYRRGLETTHPEFRGDSNSLDTVCGICRRRDFFGASQEWASGATHQASGGSGGAGRYPEPGELHLCLFLKPDADGGCAFDHGDRAADYHRRLGPVVGGIGGDSALAGDRGGFWWHDDHSATGDRRFRSGIIDYLGWRLLFSPVTRF